MCRQLVVVVTMVVILTASGLMGEWPVLADGAPYPTASSLAALRAALIDDVQSQPGGTLSIVYEDLTSHQSIELNAGQSWDPASMVKLFVMADAYAERAAGDLDFTRVITIDDDDVVPTAGFDDGQYPGLLPGTAVTVNTLVAMMITQSDNTAYNTLLDLIGRANVTAYVHRLGLAHTTIGNKLNLDPDEAAQDALVAHGVVNRTSAADVAAFFKLLYDNQLPLADDMLHLLAQQKQNYMLPAGLPDGTVMAHKVGEVGDTLRHDGGIAYLPDGGVCLVVVFSSLGSYAEVSMIGSQIADAYRAVVVNSPSTRPRPTRPLVTLTRPQGTVSSAHATWIAGALRLVLLLASISLAGLGVFAIRGGILPGGRPRRQDPS